jgi:hypothetical protein
MLFSAALKKSIPWVAASKIISIILGCGHWVWGCVISLRQGLWVWDRGVGLVFKALLKIISIIPERGYRNVARGKANVITDRRPRRMDLCSFIYRGCFSGF